MCYVDSVRQRYICSVLYFLLLVHLLLLWYVCVYSKYSLLTLYYFHLTCLFFYFTIFCTIFKGSLCSDAFLCCVVSFSACFRAIKKNFLARSVFCRHWSCTIKHFSTVLVGRMTVTAESSNNGTTTLSCINFSVGSGHVTIFSWMLTTACSLVVGLGLGLDSVSGFSVIMHTHLY